MTIETPSITHRGGAWLIEDTPATQIFAPEHLSDEHRMIGQTAEEFVTQEVLPNLERLEAKDWALARELVKKCGELGLLGVDIPEVYGGVQLDKVASIVVGEKVAPSASFASTFGAQAGLAVLPILLFGTEAQKQRYLPRLLSGEIIGAYALSESGSGSDALGARARAERSADGSHYILNGEKMWITNGGFADLFVVFAKVGGEQFSCFLVERSFPGVTTGKEEHKMGLHGSSTTPLVLQEARVPSENLLGEIGRGHKIAFNVLNFGRFKLGAMCSGGAKKAIGEAARYAAHRKQFGQPIASFGAIKHKLGEMTVRAYAVESLLYRTAGLIDAMLEGHSPTDGASVLAAVEEFAVEASIAKVSGSETLDYVLDENVQIHGGNGFVRDYPAERHYRDARVNRIFEGTNEINRLLIPGMLMRRAVKGDLALIPAARKLQDEILSLAAETTDETFLSDQIRQTRAFKKVGLLLAGTAMQKFADRLTDEQEILTYLADVLIDSYAAESAVLRAASVASQRGEQAAALYGDAARVFVNDAAARIEIAARQGLAAMAEGDVLRTQLAALRRILKIVPIDTVAPRRRIADAVVANRGYIFG